MNPAQHLSNDQIREQVKNKRAKLSEHSQFYAAQKIRQFILESPYFQQANNIACYVSVNGEVGTEKLIQSILNTGKNCYLPCLHENDPVYLSFGRFTIKTPMILNKYKIPEPDLSQTDQCCATDLDLALIPLVAFDPRGNRLGMGAGYYDNTFSFNLTRQTPVPLFGLAYSFQQFDQFATHAKDIPLTGVVTEQGCRIYSSNTE